MVGEKPSHLFRGGVRVRVTVEPAGRVVVVDEAHQLANLSWPAGYAPALVVSQQILPRWLMESIATLTTGKRPRREMYARGRDEHRGIGRLMMREVGR